MCLLQNIVILFALILVYWSGISSNIYVAISTGLIFLVYSWWILNRVCSHIEATSLELTDTRTHFEERVQHSSKEQDRLIHELKDEIAVRRNIEDALSSLRKEEDIRQRKKLAAEMHDIIGHHLQSIKLLFKIQQSEIQNGMTPDIEIQNRLVNEINLAIKQIRQMTSELYPIFLDNMDILEAIHSHSEIIKERAGFEIVIENDNDDYILSDKIKEYCFLIYQEMINNIIKHAEATLVNVKLSQLQPEWLEIEITDNGKGFDIKSIENKGHGLVLTQDRTRDIGGNLDIKSVLNEGTKVYIKMPTND